MLKFKIDSLDGLDESLHNLYEQRDGAYYLKVVGAVSEDEVAGLKQNRDALLAEKQEQKRIAAEAEAERKRLEEEAARKNGDIEALENSWRSKVEQAQQEKQAMSERIHKLTIGRAAQELASKMTKAGSVAQRWLATDAESRLSLDENGSIRVLDKEGRPSALTLQDLENEFRLNPEYSDVIVVTNSSGGGATGGGYGNGVTKKPSEMTAQERVELKQKDPNLFKQLFGK